MNVEYEALIGNLRKTIEYPKKGNLLYAIDRFVATEDLLPTTHKYTVSKNAVSLHFSNGSQYCVCYL